MSYFAHMQKIFLDFDGVIVDSNKFKEKAIEKSIFKLLGKNEKTINAINFFNINAGISRNLKLSKFFNQDDVNKILKIYNDECYYFFSKATPTDGLQEFLETIKINHAKAKLYVLSGGKKEEILFFLKKNQIFRFFEDVLASEKSKIEHLLDKEVSNNDIFIGDSNNDLKAASKINLKFILFKKYKSLKSFPSHKSRKDHVFIETEDFKSLINEIKL